MKITTPWVKTEKFIPNCQGCQREAEKEKNLLDYRGKWVLGREAACESSLRSQRHANNPTGLC